MIQEIPYAIYIENSTETTVEQPNDKKEIIELQNIPISVEIVPHKAILINSNVDTGIIQIRNNNMLTIYKCVFITFFLIPVILVLISFFI